MLMKKLISKICLQFVGLCTLSTLTSFSIYFPVNAAEKIYFVYSPIEESLKISSLEKFVEDGTIDKNLEFYLNIAKADEERTALFRQILTKKIDIDPVVISRLLKTDEGERLLNFFGNVINIQGGGNGKIALRGAIVTAAFTLHLAQNLVSGDTKY